MKDPDCGLRCSLSKTRDAASFGRADRLRRFLATFPPGLTTVHSDAWRDVGASWEPESAGGFVLWESEQRCGQVADSALWRAAGASLGCEGTNGQAAEFMGVVEYFYHGDGYDPVTWGRIITGSTLGFDTDIVCCRPGGLCAWADLAHRFYMNARLYLLALTDELAGSDGVVGGEGRHRFIGGGVLQRSHAAWRAPMPGAAARASVPVSLGPPSMWPYGGDSIPVAYDGRVFVPLVLPDGSVSQTTVHTFVAGAPPDVSCPLFTATGHLGADNTALGNWASPPLASFELPASTPVVDAARACNSSCWANATCAGWDLIKVRAQARSSSCKTTRDALSIPVARRGTPPVTPPPPTPSTQRHCTEFTPLAGHKHVGAQATALFYVLLRRGLRERSEPVRRNKADAHAVGGNDQRDVDAPAVLGRTSRDGGYADARRRAAGPRHRHQRPQSHA